MQKIFKKITKYFLLSAYLILFLGANTSFVFADGTVNVDNVITADTKATLTLTTSGGSTPISVIIDYGTSQTTYSDSSSAITIPANSSSPKEITGLTADTTYYFQVRDASVTTTIYQNGTFHTQIAGLGYDASTGASAAPQCTAGSDGYCLLAPIGGLSVIHTAELPTYFNTVYKIGIGIAAVLAIIMLVFGGIQYMSTDALSGKSDGKSKMTRAIFGLILALGSFVILNTVNPKLLNFTFNIDQARAEYTPGDTETQIPAPGSSDLYSPGGINCPLSGGPAAIPDIVNSFVGKVTYQMGGKGLAGPNGTVLYDCSGFVTRVLQCAAVTGFASGGTSSIFAGAEAVTSITATSVNGIQLKEGDLLGWTAGGGEPAGHVMIYIGSGTIAESRGPSGRVGNEIEKSNRHVNDYLTRIKFIKRIP